MPGSRISVEVLGDPASLIAAARKSADALKGLADTVAKQTDVTLKAGQKTVASNDAIAKSFQRAASSASASTRKMAVSYSTAADEQVAASDRSVVAQERMAAAAQKSAEAQVRANELAEASAVRAAEKQVASVKKVESAFGSSSSALTKAGKVISLGLVGVAVASADMAVKFQANTTRLQTQAGATAKQVDKLRQGMLQMAAEVGYTPNQLADGMYHVVSSMNAVLPASQRVSGELHIMKVAAEGAQVGHANLEDTTYALASALNALHDPGKDAQKIMGEINATVGAGDMTMQDLIDAFKSGLVPGAREAGLSMQSLGAAMAVMGDMGMRGSLAGTRLRMSIALLSSPSAAAAKVLDTLGMSSKEATSTSAAMSKALEQAGLRTTTLGADLKKPDGFMVALKDLNRHLRESGLTATGAAAVMNKAFGGGRMGATITLLAQNTDRLNTKFHQIGETAGQFGADWTTTTHTAAFELHSMEANAAALATRIGTDLLPYLKDGVHDISDFVAWLEKGSTQAHALEVAVGALATVAIGSFLVSQLKKATTLVKDLHSAFAAPFRMSGTSTGGAGGVAGTVGGAEGAMGIGGARSGYGLPGSPANPIIVAIESGEYSGLGSLSAKGTAGTAAASAEKAVGTEAVGGGEALAGITGAGAATEASVAAKLTGGLKSALGGLLKGGLIAGGGVAASQLAGHVIGGNPGKAVSDVGSGASVMAGFGSFFGPEGTLAGAVAGAVAGGFAYFLSHDADKYGDQIASRITAPFGPAVAKQFAPAIARALNNAHGDAQIANATKNMPHPHGPEADPAALSKDAAKNYELAGQKTAEAFVKGEQSVKFPSTLQVFQYISNSLDALPAQARDAAAQTMLSYAQSLQSKGKLPQGAVSELITNLETEFPGLSTYLHNQGMGMASDFAATMKMSTAVSNTQQAVTTLTSEFGNIFQTGKVTSGNLLSSVSSDFSTLRNDMGEMTHAGRVAAEADLAHLKVTATNDAATMADNVSVSIENMKSSIVSGSSQAASVAQAKFQNFAKSIAAAMAGGLLATNTGTKLIGEALNAELKAFGVKPIPLVALKSMSASSLLGYAGFVNNGSAEGTTTGIGRRATGGMVQFGQAGQRGRDTIPVNFGGSNIMVGSGEIGAVFTRQQQAVANHLMAPVGGLPGLFNNVTTPHYMATGGLVPGGALNYGQLEGLWDAGGGPKAVAPVAAAIALAESSGRDVMQQGQPFATTGWGYWQITPGGPQYLDPMTNSRAAVAKYHGAGDTFRPWTTFNDGAYRQFLKNGVAANLAGIPGGGGSISVPKVSGAGVIADMVRGNLTLAAKAANTYLTNATATSAGGAGAPFSVAGLPSGAGFSPSQLTSFDGLQVAKWIAPELGWARQHGWGGHVTSGWRPPGQVVHGEFATAPQGQSEHQYDVYPGGAVDVSDYEQFAQIIAGYPGADKLIQLGIDPLHFSGTGHSAGGIVPSFADGGFTSDLAIIKPPKAPKPKNPSKAKQHSTGLSTKDLQGLSKVGGQVGAIESQLTGLLSQYSSMSTRFGVVEQSPQFINPDGSINAAGIQQAISDDQALLGLAQQIEADYVKELPLVTQSLAKWLGSQSKTQSTITADQAKVTANKKKIAGNKIREASLRTALLDLTKPTKNTVQTIEDQIKKTRLGWSGKILAAEKAKLGFDESTVPRELSLEQAVIDAQKKKLSSSTLSEANNLKRNVLSAESAEKGYGGTDAATKDKLSTAVNQARQSYSTYLLNQSPIKAALTSASSGAELNLRQYLLTERGTQQQLTDALSTDRLSEQSAVQPLEAALLSAQVAQQKRQQRIKATSFHLRQELGQLTAEDTKLTSGDTGIQSTITSLKGVLSGAGGGAATNATVSALETVGAKLGTIQWGTGGSFRGISTDGQGAAYDEQTTVTQLQNALGTLGQESSSAAATPDTTQQQTLMAQLATQISQGNALMAAQSSVLEGFLPQVGALQIPHYDKGGPVPNDTLAMVHQGEHVVPRGGTLVMRQGTSSSIVHVDQHFHGEAAGLMQLIDQRISHPDNVRVVSRMIGQRTRMLRR